jgi:vitamin B12/bleomycin/antimicrobial peptide transport system ATP-binding/permease protein
VSILEHRTLPMSSNNRSPDTQKALLAHFWQTASGFWRGPAGRRAWLLTACLLVAVLLQLAVQYRLNFWGRDFFDAFGRRDAQALRSEAALFVPLAAFSISVAVFAIWARMTVQRQWRAWLTRLLIDRWLASDRFRQLQFTVGEDQNPEYRIAEDARIATDAPVGLLVGLVTAVLGAIVFISILWNVGGDLTMEIFGRELTVPKYLVIAVSVYSALLSVAMAVIGRRLVAVIAGKNAAEAQLRSVGGNMREREPASGAPGGQIEQQVRLTGALDVVIVSWRDLCHQFMRTTMVSQGNILLAPVIAWALCAPKYLVGTMSLGEVAQVTAAFVTVQAALNWLVENYAGVADCLSSVNRVSSLLLALDERDGRQP